MISVEKGNAPPPRGIGHCPLYALYLFWALEPKWIHQMLWNFASKFHGDQNSSSVQWKSTAQSQGHEGCIRTKILGNSLAMLLQFKTALPLHNLKVMRGAFGQKLSLISGSYIWEGAFREALGNQKLSGPKFVSNNSLQSNSSQISGSYIRVGVFEQKLSEIKIYRKFFSSAAAIKYPGSGWVHSGKSSLGSSTYQKFLSFWKYNNYENRQLWKYN